MKLDTKGSKPKIILIVVAFFLLFTALGCEAFRRKFVRRRKREKEVKVVVESKEYADKYTPKQKYRNYFLRWRVAHNQLIDSLTTDDVNRKMQKGLVGRMIDNLQRLAQLLPTKQQAKLHNLISEQREICKMLDSYRLNRIQRQRIQGILKSQKRQIQQDFSYEQVKGFLSATVETQEKQR